MAPSKTLTLICPKPSCNHKKIINKDEYASILPSQLKDGITYSLFYTCDNCQSKIKINYARDNDFQEGKITNSSIIAMNDNFLDLDSSLNYLDLDDESAKCADLSSKDLTAVFRPVNADNYVKENGLVNGKFMNLNPLKGKINLKGIKRHDFNYRGRIGVFYISNDSITFVSQSEQSDESLDKILLNKDSIMYDLISKKQNAKKNSRAAMAQNLGNEAIDFNYVDSKEGIDELNKKIQENEKKYASSQKDDATLAPRYSGLNAVKSNLKKIFAKKNLAKTIAKSSARIAVSTLIPGAPIALMIYYAIKGVNAFNSIKNLENANNIIADNKSILDQKDAERLIAQQTLDYDTQLTNDALAEVDTSKLSALDDYLMRNEYSRVDFNSDGITDYYTDNYTQTIIDDPFNEISGFDENSIPPEGPATYQEMLDEWNDSRDYNEALANQNTSQNVFDNISNEFNELVNTYGSPEALITQITNNAAQIFSLEGAMNIAAGSAIVLGVSIPFALLFGLYAQRKINKLNNGLPYFALNESQLKQVYNYKSNFNPLTLSEKSVEFDPKIKENQKKLYEINKKLEDGEEFLKKIDNKEDITHGLLILGALEKYSNFKDAIDAKESEIANEKPNADYYYNEILNNLTSGSSVSSSFIDQILKNDSIETAINVNNLPIDKWNQEVDFQNKTNLKDLVIYTRNWLKLNEDYANLKNQYSLILKQEYESLKKDKEKLEKDNEILKNDSKNVSKIMFEQLILNPGIMFTEKYEGFGGKYNLKLQANIASNTDNLNDARKEIKKIRKEIKKKGL